MDKEKLMDQLDFTQARIEEIEKQVINTEPTTRGYKELVLGYNSWVDRYDKILSELEHFDDVDIDSKRLEFEKEQEVLRNQIETDKINVEMEKLRLEREKFAHDVQTAPRKELLDIIFKGADTTVKIAVPALGLLGVIYVANLSYMNDAKLELCNGRIAGGIKDVLKIMTMKP